MPTVVSIANVATAEVAPWIRRTARVGFASKGLVYITLGFLAIGAARGLGSAQGQEGALESLLHQPFGRVMLWIIAIGLTGYMFWRLIESIKDASGRGSEAKGIAIRVGTAFKGLAYGVLGFQAARMAFRNGSSGASGEQEARSWTGTLLGMPFGRTLLFVVALWIIGYGIYQLSRAWRAKLNRDLALGYVSADARKWIIAISRFGIAARAVVFAIIGYYLFRAAQEYNPNEAKGIGGALMAMRGEAFGAILLIVIAIGLMAYGVYELVNARYRRIRT